MEMEYNPQMLEKQGLAHRKIVIFGAGRYSFELYKMVEKYGYSVFSVIDNNKALEYRRMGKNKICHPSKLFTKYDNSYIFLIASRYYGEMKKQLESYGYHENIHIFNMAKIEIPDIWHQWNDDYMDECIKNMEEGRSIHKWILEKYGTNIQIRIYPFTSIGDVYIMGLYVKKYLKSHKDSLFVYGSLKMKRLADELGFEKTLYLPMDKVYILLFYARVCGYDKVSMKLLHTDCGGEFCIWGRMLFYAGYGWMENCRELFELPEQIKPKVRRIRARNDMDDFFKKHKLLEGRTVLLSPDAQSVPLLSDEFWKRLSKRLTSMQYCVCTNIGSDEEKAIDGTIPVFVSINDVCEFTEKAGCFIGLRSGLCDLLCDSDCKRIVLYSNQGAYAIFSIKNMGFDKNLSEYIVQAENEMDIIDRIVQELSSDTHGLNNKKWVKK